MFSKELKKRKALLEKTIDKISQELPDLPPGKLRIQKSRNTPQYFHVTGKDNARGSFIRADNRELAAKLAHRTYYEKLLKVLKREHAAICSYLKCIEDKRPEEIYSAMSEYRKQLVTPLLISDKEYARRWESTPYEKNPYHPEECTQPTEKGDLVRSKSEARIADIYYALGIPYRYETPLRLKNGKIKYPDFTLLKLPERSEYYHEHMGIMEDVTYRSANIIKLNEYAASGIFTGKNLILTFEADYAPLDTRELRNILKDIFRS